MNGKTLAIIDMQGDFVDGSLGSKDAQRVVPNIVKKIEQEDWNAIVFTRDTHDENYLESQEGKWLPVPHCTYREPGWELVEAIEKAVLKKCEGETFFIPPINKPTFGTFEWKDRIRKKECNEIVLVGVCTDVCVVSNALILKAMFPEIRITVDASCCAGTSQTAHACALNTMKCCQVNVINQ